MAELEGCAPARPVAELSGPPDDIAFPAPDTELGNTPATPNTSLTLPFFHGLVTDVVCSSIALCCCYLRLRALLQSTPSQLLFAAILLCASSQCTLLPITQFIMSFTLEMRLGESGCT